MGCASVTIKVSPAAAVNTADVTQHASVFSSSPPPAVVTTKKMHNDASVSLWLVCKIGLSDEYLAVTDGLLLTKNNEYIMVRRRT